MFPDTFLTGIRTIVCLFLFLLAPQGAMSQDLSQSPLPPCPSSPNCVHQAHLFNMTPSELSDHVIAVLKEMKAEEINVGEVDHHEIHSVFKAFVFRDDVHISIQYEDGLSFLFIRSASREGYSDLGVNKRRVKKFLKLLNDRIE